MLRLVTTLINIDCIESVDVKSNKVQVTSKNGKVFSFTHMGRDETVTDQIEKKINVILLHEQQRDRQDALERQINIMEEQLRKIKEQLDDIFGFLMGKKEFEENIAKMKPSEGLE